MHEVVKLAVKRLVLCNPDPRGTAIPPNQLILEAKHLRSDSSRLGNPKPKALNPKPYTLNPKPFLSLSLSLFLSLSLSLSLSVSLSLFLSLSLSLSLSRSLSRALSGPYGERKSKGPKGGDNRVHTLVPGEHHEAKLD